jgi:hypothetical protein
VFIIDDLFLRMLGIELPGLDMIWVMDQLQKYAYAKLYDPEKIKNRIKETRMLYEFNEIAPDEYQRTNAELLRQLKLALRATEMNLNARTDILGIGEEYE